MALILTDIDDTVLTWYSEFTKWLYARKQLKSPSIPNIWRLGELLGLSEDEADALVQEFNMSEEFFNLTPCRDAEVYLSKLSEQHRIIGITSGSSKHMEHSLTWRRRADNLEKHFPGVFSDLIVLPLHGDKKPILDQYYPSYWVEDSLHNALKGLESNHEVFLIDCEHNRHYDKGDMLRVNDWADIYNRLENSDV